MTKISFIIPTYNEQANITKKLDNILAIRYPISLMEVVIIDCSTDTTMFLIKAWQEAYPMLKIILYHDDKRENAGVVFAMNKGIALSSGEIIVRTDADSTLNADCINYAIDSFKDVKIGCVTGKPVPIGSTKETEYRNINTTLQLIESRIDSTIISHGPFTAFRRNIHFKIDEGFGAEDSGTSVKIRKLGYRSILNPNITFNETITLTGREEQKIRRASALMIVLWKNKDVLFNIKYGLYGLIIYPFNFFTTIVFPIIISPILIILIALKIKGGTIIETFQILLKAIHRLLFTNKATMYWSKS